MKTVYIVDLEKLEQRYTSQWAWHIPNVLNDYIHTNNLQDKYRVQTISGTNDIPEATTPGAFLNFGGTNIYKSSQLIEIGKMFCDGTVKAGDVFLYTDAWNPTILQLKYMSTLLNIPVSIVGIWHAGSWDPNDFIGRVENKQWIKHSELALLTSINYNLVATEYHAELIHNYFDRDAIIDLWKTGFPFEYLQSMITPGTKRDMILFPHRIAPEKQLSVFKQLSEMLPQYEWVVCQEKQLTKNEYHQLLSEAKIVFSANLQETLGISMYEGVLAEAIPVVPDRLSYTEMYSDEFKYADSASIDEIAKHITHVMENYESYKSKLPLLKLKLDEQFFTGHSMYDIIFKLA
jgi:hypothetical protein